jgi:nicotinate-nucleotide adenylyltransferase
MRIGILGGTFNPIHIGHLILAEEVREKLNLDRVVFVPTNLPPHKDIRDIVSPAHRFKMIKLAINENKFFCVSDLEIKRGGKSYSIDTIIQLKKRYSHAELFFITGSDLLKYLAEWKDINKILKLVNFIVASRPGYALSKLPHNITTLKINPLAISAYEIRKRIKEQRSIRYYVPREVFKYITYEKLYQ